MRTGRNSFGRPALEAVRRRRPYCTCNHWRDNHDDEGCAICDCAEYQEPETPNVQREQMYTGLTVQLRKAKGKGPNG